MKLSIVILLLIQECLTFDLPRDGCKSNLTINDQAYNVSNIYEMGEAYPTDAHYDSHGNLFYVESGHNSNGFYFDINIIKSDSIISRKIHGLPKGASYSIAVDRKEMKTYFGTGKGIYSYDYETNNATLLSNYNLKLNMIFIDKDGNKYITENSDGVEELYLLDGEKKIRFGSMESLNEMAIDDKNNFYYIKHEKLFVLKSTLSTPVCIGNLTYSGVAQISIYKDKVFIASEKLLYFHENETRSLKLIPNVPGKVTAIAFDNVGNFVLGIRGKILKYKKNECYHRENFKV